MKKLLVLSGKGGTGKTTVSAALIQLSQAKAVADCDVDAPNLHLVMNQDVNPQVSNFLGGDKAKLDTEKCIGCGKCVKLCRFGAIKMADKKANINEFSCEGCGVCAYVCPQNAIELEKDIAGTQELFISDKVFSTATLKMGRGNSGKLVTSVKQAMIKSAPECELAVVDGSPGIGCPVIASANGMDMILIVAEPSKSGISDLKRLVKTVKSFDLQVAVCVNKYDTSLENTVEIEKFCNDENIQFVGKIPYDKKAIQAVNAGHTIVDFECESAKAIREIYESIIKN